jgi:hypothetical protein
VSKDSGGNIDPPINKAAILISKDSGENTHQ